MNPARLHAARHAAMRFLLPLMLVLLPASLGPGPALAGLPGIGDALARARAAVDRTQARIADTRAKVNAQVDNAQRIAQTPAQRAAAAVARAESLKAGVDQTVEQAREEGGNLRNIVPSTAQADGADAASAEPDGAFEPDLAAMDLGWQQALEQTSLHDLCARVARRRGESTSAHAARARAEMAAARSAVAALVSGDASVTVTVGGASIQLGGFARGASAASAGTLSFTVTLEDAADSPSFHLFDPAAQSLAGVLAAGPLEGDTKVTLRGTVRCSAIACAHLRTATDLTAHVTFRLVAFTGAGAPEAECATVRDLVLVPAGLEVLQAGSALQGVATTWAGAGN